MSGHDGHGPAPGAEAEVTDDPSAFPTFLVGIVGANLLIAVVIYVVVVFNDTLDTERTEKTLVPVPALDHYRAEQAALLESYDWVDRDAGIVTIPIDRAIDLVSLELGGDGASP